MKSLVIASILAVGFISGLANASGLAMQTDVQYLSWCEDNKIVMINEVGQTYLKEDCSVSGLVCKAKNYYVGGVELEGNQRTIYAAVCTKPVQR